jgi:hypothetical protein
MVPDVSKEPAGIIRRFFPGLLALKMKALAQRNTVTFQNIEILYNSFANQEIFLLLLKQTHHYHFGKKPSLISDLKHLT